MTLDLTSHQRHDLVDALRDAFTWDGLEQLLSFRLDLRLDQITGSSNLSQAVFDIVTYAEHRGLTDQLARAALEANPTNPRLAQLATTLGVTPVTPELERFVQNEVAFTDIDRFRSWLGEVETQVCRVEVGTDSRPTLATGFLIGPDTVITTYYALSAVIFGNLSPTDIKCRFDYKLLDDDAVLSEGTVFTLREDGWLLDASPPDARTRLLGATTDGLDYALLRVDGVPGRSPVGTIHPGAGAPSRGWITPIEVPPPRAGESLFILHHVEGGPLKLAFDTKSVINFDPATNRLAYRVNTGPGSGGAPCFDSKLNLVALHEGAIADASYGVFFPAILTRLRERGFDAFVAIKPTAVRPPPESDHAGEAVRPAAGEAVSQPAAVPSLAERLRSFQPQTQISEQISATHWAYREAAAVLATFEPSRLRPIGIDPAEAGTPAQARPALTALLAESTPVVAPGKAPR